MIEENSLKLFSRIVHKLRDIKKNCLNQKPNLCSLQNEFPDETISFYFDQHFSLQNKDKVDVFQSTSFVFSIRRK